MKINNTSKIVYMGLLISMALILSLVERSIPVPFVTPGAKLGLSNLIIIISIYTLNDFRESFIILILKIIMSSIFGGSLSSFLYSFTGGILSFFIALLIKSIFKENVSIVGVSASSAVFHNVGQLLAASLILNNFSIFLYLPILTFIGIITGSFIGISANYILSHMLKSSFFTNKFKA